MKWSTFTRVISKTSQLFLGEYNKLIAGCNYTKLPKSVTSIGDWAFAYCEGFSSLDIPDRVTSIGTAAFQGCTNLTHITIPNSVSTIGPQAFSYCI